MHSVPLENLIHTDLSLKTYNFSVSPKDIWRFNTSRRKASFHFLFEKGNGREVGSSCLFTSF